jgi:hypothetical protein
VTHQIAEILIMQISSFLKIHKAGRPFGCLFAALLGFPLIGVFFLGTVMGDCYPDKGCHDHDGTRLIFGLILTLLITSGGALIVGLLSSFIRRRLSGRAGSITITANVILVALIAAVAWLCFLPAVELLLWLQEFVVRIAVKG